MTREEKNRYQRKWRADNLEHCRAQERNRRKANLEKVRKQARDWMRNWRSQHREEDRLRSFNYRQRNPEMGKKWHRDNRERDKQLFRVRQYQLTPREYKARLVSQNGRCPICGEILVAPQIDHCHDTGKVRGILCPGCNRGLGQFKDSLLRLRAAAAYLEACAPSEFAVVSSTG